MSQLDSIILSSKKGEVFKPGSTISWVIPHRISRQVTWQVLESGGSRFLVIWSLSDLSCPTLPDKKLGVTCEFDIRAADTIKTATNNGGAHDGGAPWLIFWTCGKPGCQKIWNSPPSGFCQTPLGRPSPWYLIELDQLTMLRYQALSFDLIQLLCRILPSQPSSA